MSSVRRAEQAALAVVHGLGLLAVAGGAFVLRDTTIGSDVAEAIAGITSQLSVTLPAAVLVALAAGANFSAGAILFRAAAGTPFAGLKQAALAGLTGAVLLDTALMLALGSVGLFDWPALVIVHTAVLAVGLGMRPMVVGRRETAPPTGPAGRSFTPLAWLFIGLVWAGPLLLQLGSPVVPFLDVLPNQVAPVEHLRAFGGLASLDTTPSPIYGPSRIFLGYQATLGALAALTDVQAVTAVAAFVLPLTLLVALAGAGLAGAIGGPAAARWALLTIPLSVTFLRLADARAGVLGFALAAFALWLVIEPLGSGRRATTILAATLGAAILVHPLLGLLATASAVIATVVQHRQLAGYVLPAAVAAPVLATPQWAAMLGLDLPPWTGLLAIPLAAAALPATDRLVRRASRRAGGRPRPSNDTAADPERAIPPAADPERAIPPAAAGRPPAVLAPPALAVVAVVVVLSVVVLGAVGLVVAPRVMAHVGDTILAMLGWYPVLLVGAVLGIVLAARRPQMLLVNAALAAAVGTAVVAELVPSGSRLGDSIHFEVPKTITYFAPTVLAVAAAVGLAALWSRTGWPLLARTAVTAAFVVAAALPVRVEVVEALSLGEHRLSESLSISLRHAGRGYWQGFPDSRRLIDAEQTELVDALRNEIEEGRMAGTTQVLHLARSFQPWVATPLAVFAGVIETSATLDPEDSIHTVGGRLLHVDDLDVILGDGYRYVVLEPEGLDPGLAARLAAAGYRVLLANGRGSVMVRGATPP